MICRECEREEERIWMSLEGVLVTIEVSVLFVR
jgi:hypothetical protein